MNTHRRIHAIRSGLTAALLSIVFVGITPVDAGPPLIRDAYLLQLSPDSVLVRWRVDDTFPTDPIVEYGTDPASLTTLVTGTVAVPPSNLSERDHTVTLTGLTPGTTYYYQFGTATGGVIGGGTSAYRFTTPLPAGTAFPFSAWIVGDSGDGNDNQLAVRDAMFAATEGAGPDLFIHVGDIAYSNGTDQQYTEYFFDVYGEILRRSPIWPTMGNHDASSSTSATQFGPYFEAFVLPTAGELGGVASGTRAYYSFDHQNVHFISIDTAEGDLEPPSNMLDWLALDLASTLADWVVVFFHHPPYTKGSHDSNDGTDSGGRLVLAREEVVPILEAGGVDLVLSGHSHGYERSMLIDGAHGYGTSPDFATPATPVLIADGHVFDSGDGDPNGDGAYTKTPGLVADGAVYVVGGHGGRETGGNGGHPAMAFDEIEHGSCLLRVDGDLLWLENVRIDSSVTDRFVISKGAAIHRIVETIEGGGRIRRTPDRPLYEDGQTVTLTAEPAPGWIFDGWAGAVTGIMSTTMVTLSADAPVTAQFLPASAGGFIAFNDLAWRLGQRDENITKITSPIGGSGFPSSGELVDRASGLATGVTLTVEGGTYDGGDHALDLSGGPLPGVDAWDVFDGHVTAHGCISYIASPSPTGDLRLILTGLDPSSRYDLVLYGHRNYYGWDRAVLVTLEDSIGFLNASSVGIDNPEPGSGGALFSGPGDPSTRLPSDNPAGYVARFIEVDPGSDGEVRLVCTYDGDSGNPWRGKYANALRVVESPMPTGTSFRRGDPNGTGSPDIGDVVHILSYIFLGSPLDCLESGDISVDGALTIGDPINLLGYLFAGGPPPAPPFPSCGAVAGGVGCAFYPSCP